MQEDTAGGYKEKSDGCMQVLWNREKKSAQSIFGCVLYSSFVSKDYGEFP